MAGERANCPHRWEETEFGKKYWEPGTYQYTCRRCGKMNMVRLVSTKEKPNE